MINRHRGDEARQEARAVSYDIDAVRARIKDIESGKVPEPVSAPSEPETFTKTDRKAGGSQGGAWYKDPDGKEWFGKTYETSADAADRVSNEDVANRIYRMFGVEA